MKDNHNNSILNHKDLEAILMHYCTTVEINKNQNEYDSRSDGPLSGSFLTNEDVGLAYVR